MVRYWLRSSREDLRAARTLFKGEHYRLAMFCCHLSIEKALKAILQNQTGVLPPRTHDLRSLLTRTALTAPSRLTRFVNQMAVLSVPTRYPGRLSHGPLSFRKPQVERSIGLTQKVIEWCRRNC